MLVLLILITASTSLKHYFILNQGCLKAYYSNTDGARHMIQFAIENGERNYFEVFYLNESTKLYVEAIEDASLLAIYQEKLDLLLVKALIFKCYFRILVTMPFLPTVIVSVLHWTKEPRNVTCCFVPSIHSQKTRCKD